MTKIFKTTLLAGGLLLPCIAVGQTADHILVSTANGKKAYSMEEVRSIIVQEEGIVVNTATSTSNFSYEDLISLKFLDAATGIYQPSLTVNDFTLEALGDIIRVKGWNANRTTTVRIFSINGRNVMQLKGWSGADIHLASLPSGIYIANIDNQTIKIKK